MISDTRLPEEPVVSVFMITWNQAHFVGRAIESVLEQRTTFPVELVIGEDRSTDGTREIVQAFQRRHPDRIRLLLNPVNVGWRENSLRTFAACRGKYIALLEGDDYWTDPDKLQLQVELMESHPNAFICGARALVWKQGEPEPKDVTPPEPTEILAEYGAQELLRGLWWFRTCTKLLRRADVEATPTRFREKDWAGTLWLVARSNFGMVCFLDRVVGVYREHAGGVWSSLPRHERVISDVHELYLLVPVFRGENRRYLRDLLSRNVQELMESPHVHWRDRLVCAWLAALRNARDAAAWRRVAGSLRMAASGA